MQAQINTSRVLAIGKNALFFEDYVLSIQYFNQVIKSKPYLAEPYLFRALAKFSLEDYKGAEVDFSLCLERNPFLVYAYQYRGAARQNQNNFEGAIEDYDKGLEFRPEDRQMLLNKAIAFAQDKRYEESLATLDLLLSYQPKYLYAYLTRGAVRTERGDTLLAFEDFNTALSLDKHSAPAFAQRAVLYLQTGDYPAALADFDQAIRLEAKQVGYYINRGLTRFHLNDLRGAMADYDAVVRMDARNPVARFNRGLLRSQVGDVYGSIEDFNTVIEIEPENFMAIYNRAILNNEAMQYGEAVDDLNRVVEEYPNFVPAFYFRSEIKRKMNDASGSDKDYWHAYNLEQKLRRLREEGKVVTGKGVYDTADAADTDAGQSEKIREKSDNDIAKFNRLVVYDREEEQQSKYRSEIRGEVQNRQVRVDLAPQFVLAFYEEASVAIDYPASRIDPMVSDYNARQSSSLQLRIINREAALTDDQAAYHFQSIDNYSLVLDRNPENAEAYFGRALDFMVLQDLQEALDDYDRAIQRDQGFVPAYFNRAVVRYKLLEISDYSKENAGSSHSLSYHLETTAGRIKPAVSGGKAVVRPVEDLLSEADKSKRGLELSLILQDYNTVIGINPDFVYAWFNRANIRCLQKDYREAINDYNEAIQRNPDFAEAWFNRGLTRLYLGDTGRGIEDLSKAGELGMIDAYSIIKKMTAE
jgi:tetratricopeptide (TPR) repeat protein